MRQMHGAFGRAGYAGKEDKTGRSNPKFKKVEKELEWGDWLRMHMGDDRTLRLKGVNTEDARRILRIYSERGQGARGR